VSTFFDRRNYLKLGPQGGIGKREKKVGSELTKSLTKTNLFARKPIRLVRHLQLKAVLL
jgi:hypothetical protein